MHDKLNRFAAAIGVSLLLGACAHVSRPAATPPPRVPAAPPAPSIAAQIPPDVLAACRQSFVEGRAGRFAQAEKLTKTCLASESLPLRARLTMLQTLMAYETAQHAYAAAIDSELAVIELTPQPVDSQQVLLASLYRLDKRYAQGLDTLERVRARHEAKHDLDLTVGPDYYRERGAALVGLERYPEAIDALTRAIAMAPASAMAYFERARAYEALGKTAAARADYVEVARWAIDKGLHTATRAKLHALGIDPAVERRHPFGKANPLRDAHRQGLNAMCRAPSARPAARSASERAAAYYTQSLCYDGVDRHTAALAAIDKAILLAPGNLQYRQSKVTTLAVLGRLDDALALAAPLRRQAHAQAGASTRPSDIYRRYQEVSATVAFIYLHRQEWAQAEQAFVDMAKGAPPYDQDYVAATYLWMRAKGGAAAPVNAYFEDYIRRATATQVAVNYRHALLLYMLGRTNLATVYALVVRLPAAPSIQNALAETWFLAAARARYIDHDPAAARAYLQRLNDLQPYGTNEWDMAKKGDV